MLTTMQELRAIISSSTEWGWSDDTLRIAGYHAEKRAYAFLRMQVRRFYIQTVFLLSKIMQSFENYLSLCCCCCQCCQSALNNVF